MTTDDAYRKLFQMVLGAGYTSEYGHELITAIQQPSKELQKEWELLAREWRTMYYKLKDGDL